MFSPDHLVEQFKLTQTYCRIVWDSPPATPRLIEFLDQQSELVSGVIYMSPEEYAVVFLNQREIRVFPGAVLLISDASQEFPELPDYTGNLTVIGFSEASGRLYNRLVTYIGAPLERDSSTRFSGIWGEIMSNPALMVSEIREKLQKLPGLVEPFVQVAVAVFNNPDGCDVPYSRILHQLKALIPNCCATVRDKEIIILITYKERRFTNPFDFDQITTVLEKYNGYMGISNGTRQVDSLKALYQLTRRIITLACEMKISAPDRIFTFERVGTYSAIDLCTRAFFEHIDRKSLLYLAHPAVIAISRYDRDHNDNLREVLYFYLFNDRSITVTANALYMHRNTVLNKIRKINHLIGLDLEDRHLRQRLLFSCQLIHYFEEIVKDELKL